MDEEVGGDLNKPIEQEEDVGITLYALIGTPTPGTMRVRGKINGSRLVLLVDTGSTHNFVDALVVSSLQLKIDVSRILEVKVANGTLVRTQGFLLSPSGAQMGPLSSFGQASHLTNSGGMRVHDLKLSSAHGIISTRTSISGETKMEKVYHLFQ